MHKEFDSHKPSILDGSVELDDSKWKKGFASVLQLVVATKL